MLRTLLRLQFLAFRRAPFLGGRVALAGMQSLGMAYGIFCAGAIGFLLPDILSVWAPNVSAVRIVDLGLLPALAALTGARMIFQDIPTRGSHAFLLLPVDRRKVSNAILLRSLANPLNAIPIVFAVPFALRTVRATDGWPGAAAFLIGVIALVAVSHLALVVWKTRLGDHVVSTILGLGAAFGGIAALDIVLTGLIRALRTVGFLPAALLVLVATALGAVAYSGMREALYLDSNVKRRRKQAASGFEKSGVRAYIDMDVRLLLRTRFPRSTAANSAFVSLALTGVVLFVADPTTMSLVLLFSTGTVAGSIGQFALPFASGHYDRLLTLPDAVDTFVRARLALLGLTTVALGSLQLALVLAFAPSAWPSIVASVLFSSGILAPVAVLGSTIAPKPLDVSEGVAFNYKVQSFAAQVVIMATAVPVGIIVVALGPSAGTLFAGSLGAAGLTAAPVWIRFLSGRIDQQRYGVAARFRTAL